MKVYIEHVNHIRKNHGIPTQTIEEANAEYYDVPELPLQELICVMSDEIVDLKRRVKELEKD